MKQANTEFMKGFIEHQEKERFLEEYFGSGVKDIKANHPDFMGGIKRVADSPEGIKELNRVRHCKPSHGT